MNPTAQVLARCFNFAALNFDALTESAKLQTFEHMQAWAQEYARKRNAKVEVIANMKAILQQLESAL